MALQDKTITCKDCGEEFIFTVKEQEFYQEKGFENEPSRCKTCRDQKKARFGGQRTMYPVVCADCGMETTVPFEPKEGGRPVYCRECLTKHRDDS